MDYTVKAGDNLSKIAQVNNTNVNSLASLNKLSNPNLVTVGQTLKLPVNTSVNSNFGALTTGGAMQGNLTPPTLVMPDVKPITNAALVENSFAIPEENKYFTEDESTLQQIKREMGLLESKSADTAAANNTFKVNDNRALVRSISDEILNLGDRTESAKQLIGTNQGGLTVNDRGANEELLQRQKTAKMLDLGVSLRSAQGKLTDAQDLAAEAINAKYGGIQARIDTLKTSLELNKPFLERYDKKAYEKQTALLNAQQKDLEEKKKTEKELSDLVINSAQQGAPLDLQNKAKKAKTPMEAATILGVYAGDYRKARLLEQQIKTEQAQQSKYYADAAKTRGEIAGSGANSIGVSPQGTIADSWLKQYNAGAMSLEDIYTKIGNTKESNKIKNELSQLVAGQGGKRVLTMDDAQIGAINSQIKNIDDLIVGNGIEGNGYNYKVISGATQGGGLGFGARISSAKEDALAIARNLVANQTLQSLADAKAKGVTFGALSGPELNAVASAASRVASKAITDKESGKITGFEGSESAFLEDLKEIKKGLQNSIKTKTNQPKDELDNYADIGEKNLKDVRAKLSQPTAQSSGYQRTN